MIGYTEFERPLQDYAKGGYTLTEVDRDIIPKWVRYPINNLLFGAKKRNIFGIFRKPVFIISQDAKSGKYTIYSLRKEYDKAANNLASELELGYFNEHYFRKALIL